MSGAGQLVIATRSDLEALPRRLSPGQSPVRLSLVLPGLAEPARSLWETRLATQLSACGCSEGAIGLVIGLVPATALAFGPHLAPGGWARWGVFLAVLVLASLGGKCVGLARARRRMRQEVDRLLAQLDPPGPSPLTNPPHRRLPPEDAVIAG
jgi:hypothetical protein